MSRFHDHMRKGDYGLHEHETGNTIRLGVYATGRRLQPGETIHEDDVYASSSGRWEKAPCSGLVLQEGCDTYWVRSAFTDELLDAEDEAKKQVEGKSSD